MAGDDLDEAFLIEAFETALDGDFAQSGYGGTFGDHAGEFVGDEAHFHEGDPTAVAGAVAFVAADFLVDRVGGGFIEGTVVVVPGLFAVALLVAAPQAARILRPVCRMLAVERALLRPGVPARVVVPREPVAKRPRVKPAPLDWGRIPLPRGVLAAARRQGFGRRRDHLGEGD